ncbi:hypothetical protein VTO73DRAFT_12704 [Trametes versicolor]
MSIQLKDSYFAAPERGPRAEGDEFAEYVVRVVSPFLPEPKPAWYTPTLSAAATRVIAALRNTLPTTPTYQERLLALKNKFPESPDESVAGEPAADLPAAEEPAPPVPSARTRSKAKGRVQSEASDAPPPAHSGCGPGSAAAPTESAPTDEPASGGEKPPAKTKAGGKKTKGKKPAPRDAIVIEGDWTGAPRCLYCSTRSEPCVLRPGVQTCDRCARDSKGCYAPDTTPEDLAAKRAQRFVQYHDAKGYARCLLEPRDDGALVATYRGKIPSPAAAPMAPAGGQVAVPAAASVAGPSGTAGNADADTDAEPDTVAGPSGKTDEADADADADADAEPGSPTEARPPSSPAPPPTIATLPGLEGAIPFSPSWAHIEVRREVRFLCDSDVDVKPFPQPTFVDPELVFSKGGAGRRKGTRAADPDAASSTSTKKTARRGTVRRPTVGARDASGSARAASGSRGRGASGSRSGDQDALADLSHEAQVAVLAIRAEREAQVARRGVIDRIIASLDEQERELLGAADYEGGEGMGAGSDGSDAEDEGGDDDE